MRNHLAWLPRRVRPGPKHLSNGAGGLGHQQYLSSSKNPNGYCGIGGTGVSCPVGVAPAGD